MARCHAFLVLKINSDGGKEMKALTAVVLERWPSRGEQAQGAGQVVDCTDAQAG